MLSDENKFHEYNLLNVQATQPGTSEHTFGVVSMQAKSRETQRWKELEKGTTLKWHTILELRSQHMYAPSV